MTPLLRLASYNLLHGISIRSGLVELGQAAEAIAALRADVVALQEADRGLARSGGFDQVAELARRTGMHGVFAPALLGDPDGRWTAAQGEDSGGPGYGVGLLSRTPLHAPERIALPGGGLRRGTRAGTTSRASPWRRPSRSPASACASRRRTSPTCRGEGSPNSASPPLPWPRSPVPRH